MELTGTADTTQGASDNFFSVFDGGTITIDLTRTPLGGGVRIFDDILTLNLSSSFGTVPANNEQALSLFAEVSSVQTGVFFDESGNDFADLLAGGQTIEFLGQTNLTDLDVVPSANGNPNEFTRNTQFGSITFTQVPEPSSLVMMGFALLGLAGVRRRNS